MSFRYHLTAPSDGGGGTKTWICRPSPNGGLIIEFGKTGAKRLRQLEVPSIKCKDTPEAEARKRCEDQIRQGYTYATPTPDQSPGVADWSCKRLLRADVEGAVKLLHGKPELQKVFSFDALDSGGISLHFAQTDVPVRIKFGVFSGGSIDTKEALLVFTALSVRVPQLTLALRAGGMEFRGSGSDATAFLRQAGLDKPQWHEALVAAGLRRNLSLKSTESSWF